VGPLVDAIHNQCLLEYDVLPVAAGPFLHTSLLIPPLLGLAYVVLGGILPGIAARILELSSGGGTEGSGDGGRRPADAAMAPPRTSLFRAASAVVSTAAIIKLSEVLQTGPADAPTALLVMATAALLQWAVLDGTAASLAAAVATAVGGPLSELPFVASGCWHYVDSAADYFPLASIGEMIGDGGLGAIALSSITGPCYFAVTMDAIALRRYFDDN